MPRIALPSRCFILATLAAIAVPACAEVSDEANATTGSQERSILVQPRADEKTAVPTATALKEKLVEPIQSENDSAEEVDLAASTAELIETIRESHPWARFEPGAWRRVTVTSEVFDEQGAFAGRSLSERTERLTAVDETTYTLSIESVVELGGLRTPAPAELRRFSVLTDRMADDEGSVTAKPGEPSSISLGGTVASCRTWTFESKNPKNTETETLHLATGTGPVILRRERQTTLDGEPGRQQTESVTRLETPAPFGDELASTWHATTTTTHPTGARSEAFSVRGKDAPGGLFSESITEYDASGQKTRWAVTRLVASGRTPAENIGSQPDGDNIPAVSIEVRPRRFLRLLRRDERQQDALKAQ